MPSVPLVAHHESAESATVMHCATCGYGPEWHEGPTLKCPGQPGKWRDPPPVDRSTWREIIARDSAARQAVIDVARRPYVPVVVPPPQVPARPAAGPSEMARYQGRQALGVGRRAAAAGWTVAAYYARSHDGTELSAVKMYRGALRAVATWTRPAGNIGKLSGWRADVAYGWINGSMPQKVNHTDLEGYLDA